MWHREPYTVPDRAFFILGCLISLASYAALAVSYHALPEFVPIHYGFSGTPDVYAAKGFMSVFGLALIQAAVSVLILWLFLHPEYANVPGRVPLRKLSPPYRKAIEWVIRHMAMMMFVLVALMFAYIVLTDIGVGLGYTSHLNPWPLALLMMVLVGLNLVYLTMIVRLSRLAAKRKKLPAGWSI